MYRKIQLGQEFNTRNLEEQAEDLGILMKYRPMVIQALYDMLDNVNDPFIKSYVNWHSKHLFKMMKDKIDIGVDPLDARHRIDKQIIESWLIEAENVKKESLLLRNKEHEHLDLVNDQKVQQMREEQRVRFAELANKKEQDARKDGLQRIYDLWNEAQVKEHLAEALAPVPSGAEEAKIEEVKAEPRPRTKSGNVPEPAAAAKAKSGDGEEESKHPMSSSSDQPTMLEQQTLEEMPGKRKQDHALALIEAQPVPVKNELGGLEANLKEMREIAKARNSLRKSGDEKQKELVKKYLEAYKAMIKDEYDYEVTMEGTPTQKQTEKDLVAKAKQKRQKESPLKEPSEGSDQ